MTEPECTCWYGSYVKPEGGTGFDLARYDPACPEHFGGDEEDSDEER